MHLGGCAELFTHHEDAASNKIHIGDPALSYLCASVMPSYSRLGKMKQIRKYSDFISESAAAGVNVKQMGFSTLIILTS